MPSGAEKQHYVGGVCSKGSLVYRAFSTSITSATLPSGLRNGNGLPVYLCEMGVNIVAVAIRTPLDHAPTKLGFLVRIMKINDGERDTRVTPGVLRLKRAFSRADQYAIIVDVPEISADDRENLRYSKCCISRMS